MTKLYHGTSRHALDSIMVDGIKPRGKKGRSNWKETVESNPNCVYLSEGYALYFAINAGKDLSDIAIVEVDTDALFHLDLLPDEDAIEQTNRAGGDDLPEAWDIKKRTRHYRKRMLGYRGQHNASLKALGTCCHHGVVPVTALTRVATLDLKQNPALRRACDPSICLANYRIMGGYYRQLNNHIFGDAVDISDFGMVRREGDDGFTQMPRTGIVVTTVNQPAIVAA